MVRNTYLLEVEESSGDQRFTTRHLIEAMDEQMVKYHFHRTLKDFGYNDCQHGKHELESWDLGLAAEIADIRKLDDVEETVLDRYLSYWTKV